MRLAETCNAKSPDSADLVVVELAALFHDLFDRKYEKVNSSKTLDIATWLETRPTSEKQRDLIIRIISNVSYSKEIVLRQSGGWTSWHQSCVELHCVMDADKLDAIGTFGVFRCAAFSGAKNLPLYLAKSDKEYENSSVGHFYDKLFKLKDMMMTETGRKVAERRTATMKQIVRRIEEEAELLDFDP